MNYDSQPSTSRFASLLNRIHSKPKVDRKGEVIEELKEVINFEVLRYLSMNEAAALLAELIRDTEVSQYADDITMGDLLGFVAPKQEASGTRTRITKEAMEACRADTAAYFDTLNGKVGMAKIVKDLLAKNGDYTESAIKQCVRELLEGKIVKSEGERRAMVYFKAGTSKKH